MGCAGGTHGFVGAQDALAFVLSLAFFLICPHDVPESKGGLDHPSNMQWLSRKEHQEKTKMDMAQ